MSQYHQQLLTSPRRLVPGKDGNKDYSDADKYDVSGQLEMFCKILGPCCQTSQMSWMQCSIWREIVIDESVDSSDGDDSDEDDSDDCFNDTCDNDRTGQKERFT